MSEAEAMFHAWAVDFRVKSTIDKLKTEGERASSG